MNPPWRHALIADRIFLTHHSDCFARLGYHAVTIRQIAEEAHVPLALVGCYFGRSRALRCHFGHWSGIVRRRLTDIQAALEPVGGDRLARIVDALVLPSARLRETPRGAPCLLVTRGLSQQGRKKIAPSVSF